MGNVFPGEVTTESCVRRPQFKRVWSSLTLKHFQTFTLSGFEYSYLNPRAFRWNIQRARQHLLYGKGRCVRWHRSVQKQHTTRFVWG